MSGKATLKENLKTTKARKTQPRDRRSKLIQRLWAAAEGQVREIESRLHLLGSDTVQFERDSRSLALLAKFLKELVSIEGLMRESIPPSRAANCQIEDDDAPPRDIEEFRIELAKRLETMRIGREPEGNHQSGRSALADTVTG